MKNYTIDKYTKILNQTERFCDSFSYDTAYKIISEVDAKELQKDIDKKRYYYLIGKSTLLSGNDAVNVIPTLEKALNIPSLDENSFLNVLILNILAVAYLKEGNIKRAGELFDETYEKLQHQKVIMPSILNKALLIIFNCAKYQSELNNYDEAIELCNNGIMLSKRGESIVHLDKLYYEKAFNLYKKGQKIGSTKCYFYALAFVEINRNSSLKMTIANDLKEFEISFDDYI